MYNWARWLLMAVFVTEVYLGAIAKHVDANGAAHVGSTVAKYSPASARHGQRFGNYNTSHLLVVDSASVTLRLPVSRH